MDSQSPNSRHKMPSFLSSLKEGFMLLRASSNRLSMRTSSGSSTIGLKLESEYPVPPVAPSFGSFIDQDRPGHRWVTMRGKFGDGEDIQIEATSFGAAAVVQMPDEDKSGQELRLHISLLVRVLKQEQDGEGAFEFVCSAWPDSLLIQNVYVVFQHEKIRAVPYMGPNFRKVDEKMRKAFHDFLETRGINNELVAFLHEHMTNKERSESFRWLQSLKTFYEK